MVAPRCRAATLASHLVGNPETNPSASPVRCDLGQFHAAISVCNGARRLRSSRQLRHLCFQHFGGNVFSVRALTSIAGVQASNDVAPAKAGAGSCLRTTQPRPRWKWNRIDVSVEGRW